MAYPGIMSAPGGSGGLSGPMMGEPGGLVGGGWRPNAGAISPTPQGFGGQSNEGFGGGTPWQGQAQGGIAAQGPMPQVGIASQGLMSQANPFTSNPFYSQGSMNPYQNQLMGGQGWGQGWGQQGQWGQQGFPSQWGQQGSPWAGLFNNQLFGY